jgi:hypothetical protein
LVVRRSAATPPPNPSTALPVRKNLVSALSSLIEKTIC